jgi:hypothetical protein
MVLQKIFQGIQLKMQGLQDILIAFSLLVAERREVNARLLGDNNWSVDMV